MRVHCTFTIPKLFIMTSSPRGDSCRREYRLISRVLSLYEPMVHDYCVFDHCIFFGGGGGRGVYLTRETETTDVFLG